MSAYFAKVGDNNIVELCMVLNDEDVTDKKSWWDPLKLFTGKRDSEQVGIAFCQKHEFAPGVISEGGRWVQAFRPPSGYAGTGIRGNIPSDGYAYMSGVRTLGVASTDIFIEPRPLDMNGKLCESWSIGINTAQWYSPLLDVGDGEYPYMGEEPLRTWEEKKAGKYYLWDEERYQKDNTTGWVLL